MAHPALLARCGLAASGASGGSRRGQLPLPAGRGSRQRQAMDPTGCTIVARAAYICKNGLCEPLDPAQAPRWGGAARLDVRRCHGQGCRRLHGWQHAGLTVHASRHITYVAPVRVPAFPT